MAPRVVGGVFVADVEMGTHSSLIALPSQHPIVPWPAKDWHRGDMPAAIDPRGFQRLLDVAFAGSDGPVGSTHALLIAHHGRLLFEQYGPDHSPESQHLSWSVAKSVLHAFIGTLVRDDILDLDSPTGLPHWQQDQRKDITLRDLLAMRSGLSWVEDYVDDSVSDVIEMLFGSGLANHGAFSAAQPASHPSGVQWNYSSGTSNIIADISRRALNLTDEASFRRALQERLFTPLSMTSADPGFDASGNFVASSYLHASAEDYLRFGHFYLRDGVWANERLLPPGWVDLARTTHATEEETGMGYGHHWWTKPDDFGTFAASGYDGQRIQIVPAMDLVFVRFGKTEQDDLPALNQWYEDLVEHLRPLAR